MCYAYFSESMNEESERYRLKYTQIQNDLAALQRQYQDEKSERESALEELKRQVYLSLLLFYAILR